jgi:hypothetical protein
VLDPTHTAQMNQRLGIWGYAQVGFGAAGLAKNGFALYNIFSLLGSFDELPFLSPILWLDMALVSELLLSNKRSKPLGFVAVGIGVFMYVVSLWLVIGYSALGYGTRQYQALNIPPYCQTLGKSWQTDPRRRYFVGLQVLIFISATAGVVFSYFAYRWLEDRRRRREERQRELDRTAEDRQQQQEDQRYQTLLDDVNLTSLERWAKGFGEWKKRQRNKLKSWFSRSNNGDPGLRHPRYIVIPRVWIFPGFRIPLRWPGSIWLLPPIWGTRFQGFQIPLRMPQRIGPIFGVEIPIAVFKPQIELSELMHVVVMSFVLVPLLIGVGANQETWHSNNQTNRDGIVMSSDYSGLTSLTNYSVAIV